MRVCSFCHRCFDDLEGSCTDDGHLLSETRNGSLDMIPGYMLDLLLSTGITGDVYRARQTACGRSCLITIHSSDVKNRTEFLEEANRAASLFHPSLADVYEAGSLESGECFVVAEDPENETLRAHMDANGAPNLLDAILIVRQTAEALHALHSKGLTHRALRPENIILTYDADGQQLIRLQNIDFGGVVERSIISNKFLIDSALDSLRYFAPEQCSGEAVGIKADLYSLGIVLYEMLAGAPPFDAATAAGLIEKHRNQRPPEMRIDNFELRMLITHTMMESLHKRPDKRQSSANAFARQLRHIEQLATHVSTPPPAVATSAPSKKIVRMLQPPAIKKTPAIALNEDIHREMPATIQTRKAPSGISERRIDLVPVAEPEKPIETPRIVESGPARSAVEDFGTAIANFVMEKSAPAISRFSRLKQRRKKTHPQPAPHTTNASREQAKKSPKTGLISPEAAAIELYREMAAVKRLRAKHAKKIEWLQPEDDIPSLADVQSLMTTGEPVQLSAMPEPPKASVVEETMDEIHTLGAQTAKIETSLPKSLSMVSEIPKFFEQEPVRVTAIEVVTQDAQPGSPAPESTHNEPIAAAGVPSVPAEFAAESIIEKPAEPAPPPADKPVAPVVQPQKKLAASAAAASSGPVFQLRPRGIRVSGLQTRGPVARHEEPEEITLVSPVRSRFRVDLDKPQTARKHTPARRVVPLPATELEFFPTLLGGSAKPASLEPADSILAACYPASGSRSLPYRSLAIGSGLVLLIAFFLFANDAIWKYVPLETAGDSVAAKSTATKGTSVVISPATAAVEPAAKKPAKIADKPAANDKDDAPPAAVATKKSVEPSTEKASTPARTKANPSSATTPARVIVVGTAAAKPFKNSESERRPVDKKPIEIPAKSNGATRPRIVREPGR
jgi:serine/threonine protein kinase